MTDIGTDDAARQLAEIEARQASALQRALLPAWYWWAVAIGMVLLGLIVDTQPRSEIIVSALTFAVLVAGLSVWAILGGLTGARVRPELLGPQGGAGIVVLDLVTVGGSIGIAFATRALGLPFPATIGTICGAVVLVAGGPLLMGWLERLMRARVRR